MNRCLCGIALGCQVDGKVPLCWPIPSRDVDCSIAVAARTLVANLGALVGAALVWSYLGCAGGDAFGYDVCQVCSNGVCSCGVGEAAVAEADRVAAADVVAVAIAASVVCREVVIEMVQCSAWGDAWGLWRIARAALRDVSDGAGYAEGGSG